MYRAVALKAIQNNIQPTELEKVDEILQDIKIEIKRQDGNQYIMLDGKDVSKDIRTSIVDDCVAKFSALKSVREKMTPLQRDMRNMGNIIMEGRDIGTTVFPDADVKIYLDASFEERAKRRYKQNIEKGISCTYEEILSAIKERHKLETERKLSPLVQADDAIYIDTTNMTIDEVVEKVIDEIMIKLIDSIKEREANR